MGFKSSRLLFIAVIALIVIPVSPQTGANPTVAGLSQCVNNCTRPILKSNACDPVRDPSCICGSQITDALATCIRAKCTPEDGLEAKKYQAETCNYPVRSLVDNGVAVCWALFAVAILFSVFRVVSRSKVWGGAGYWWDDWMLLVCLLPMTGITVVGFLGYETGLGRDYWEVGIPGIEASLKYFFAGQPLYIAVVFGTKISLVLLYLRIFLTDARALRAACWIVVSALAMSLVAFEFATIFQCIPISYNWTEFNGGTGHCTDRQSQVYAAAGINIFFDVLVILLPLQQILKLGISSMKKIGICSVFLVGVVVIACSCVRLQYLIRYGKDDNVTYNYTYIAIWSLVEVHLSIVCVCMPATAGLAYRTWKFARGDEVATMTRPGTAADCDGKKLMGVGDVPVAEEGRVLATEGQVRGLGLQGVGVESSKSSEDDQRGFYFDGKWFTEGQAQGEASDSPQMMNLNRDSVQKPEAAHLEALEADAPAEQRPQSPDRPHLSRGRSVPGKGDDRTATAALEDTVSGAGSGNSDESGSKACAEANEELAAIRADMSLNPTRNPTETTTEHTSKVTSMNSPHHNSAITSNTLSRNSSADNGVLLPPSNDISMSNSFQGRNSDDTDEAASSEPSTAKAHEDHPLRSQGVSMPNSRPTTPTEEQRRANMTRSASSSLFNSRRASGEHAEQVLRNAFQREGQKQNGRPREVTRSASSSLFNSIVPTRRPSTADGARSSGGMISTPDNRGQSGDLRAARYARSYVAYYERPSPVPIQPSSDRNASEGSLNTKRNKDFQAILEAKRRSLRSRSNDSSLFQNHSHQSDRSQQSIDSNVMRTDSDQSVQSLEPQTFESIGDQLRTESEQRLAVQAAHATLGVELGMPLNDDDGVPLGEDQSGPWPNVPMGDTELETGESSHVVSPLSHEHSHKQSHKHSHIVSPMSPDYRPADPQADVPQRQYSQPPSPGRPGFSSHPLEMMRTQPPLSRTSTGNSSHPPRSQSRPVSSAEAKRNSDSARAAATLREMQGNRDYDGHRHQSTDEGDAREEQHQQRPADLSRAPSLRTQMRAIQQPTFDQQVRESQANVQEPPSMRGHMFPGTSEEQPPSIVQQHLEQLSAITSASAAGGERQSGDSGQSDETHDSTYSSAESGELDGSAKHQEQLEGQYPPSSPTDATYTTADEDQSTTSAHPLQDYVSEGNPYEASNLKDDLMDIPSRVSAVVVDGPSGRYELRRTLTDVSSDQPSAEEILAVTPQEGWRHQITGQSYFPAPENMANSTAAMIHKIPREKLAKASASNNGGISTEQVSNQAASAGSWHNSGGIPRSSSNSRPRFVEEYNTNRWRSFKPQLPAESRGSSVHSFFRRQEDNSCSGIYSDRNNNSSQSSGFRPYPENQFSPRRPSSFDGSFYSGSDSGSRQNFRPPYEQQFSPERPQYWRYNSERSYRPRYDDRQYSNYGSEQSYRPRYDDHQQSPYDDSRFSPERPWQPRYDSYQSFQPRSEDQFLPPREYQSRRQSYHSFRPQYDDHFSPQRSLGSRRTLNFTSQQPQVEGQFSPQRPQLSRYSSNFSDASFREWKANHQYQPTSPHPTEEVMSLIAQHELWNERNPTEFSRDGTEPSQAVNLQRKSDERLAYMENELPDPEAVDYSPSTYRDSPSTSPQEDPGSPGISVPHYEFEASEEHRNRSDDWDRIQKQQAQERRERRTSGYQSSEGQRSRTDNDTASEASTQKWNPVRPASQQTSKSTLRPTSNSSIRRDSRDSWLEDQEARRQIAAAESKDDEDRKASRYSGIYAYDPPTAEMVSAIAGPTNEWGIDHEKPPGFAAPIKPPSPDNATAKWEPVLSPKASRTKVPQVKDTKEDLPLRADPKNPNISSFQQHRSSQTALYKPHHSRQSSSLSTSTIGKLSQADEHRHEAEHRSQQAKDVEKYLTSRTGFAKGDATSGAQRHLMAYQDQMWDSPAARFAQIAAESRPTTALKHYPVGSPDLKKPHRDPYQAQKMHEELSSTAKAAEQAKTVIDYDSPMDKGFPPSLTTTESEEDSTYSSTDMSDSDLSSPSPHNYMDATANIPRFRPAEEPKYRFDAGNAKKDENVPRYVPTEEETRRRAKAYAIARQIIQQSRASDSDEYEPYRRPSTADGDHSARPSPPKMFEAYKSNDSSRKKASNHVEAVGKKVSERASTSSTDSSGSSCSAPLSEKSLAGIGSRHGPAQRASDVDVKARPGQKGRELRMSWQG